jgi:vanadium-dependent haloperoxidase-like protein
MKDSILFWNEVALEANRVSHTNGKMEQTGPPLSARALAIVHLAMYDAYAAVNKAAGLSPYLPGLPPPPSGASAQAAVAGAAHKTLSNLYRAQRNFFDAKLEEFGGEADPGFGFGEIVARAILEDRDGDPGVSAEGFVPSMKRGHHRVDPDNPDQGFHGPFYGAGSKGFAITKRHELNRPPFDNEEYLKALREVRGRGIALDLAGTLPRDIEFRTIDQSLIGVYWAYDGSAKLGTPPRQNNQIVRRIAIAQKNTEAQNARLFALVNVAMADAGILAWTEKYRHDLWRPVVGIREHDASLGPAPGESDNDISDDADTGWLPFGAPASNSLSKNFTPNFPAYPSGHATFGAAAFHITRLFYKVPIGDRKPDNLFKGLDIVSDEFNGTNTDNRGTVRPNHLRNFPDGLWQMIEEIGRSRVYLGVHWVFDAFAVKNNGEPDLSRNIGGVQLGLTIAEDIFGSGLKKSPVGPLPQK